ncbi:hypothetical protein [Crocinitomix algicola]|uniref:hypothetical protein n=1 Tax=Crocinitomix algicola TaxID=1740263 RepID=UPI001112FDAA|nr:hypothetical protein [Crocinitomix algicola]
MKSLKSDLFKKFEDSNLTKESLQIVEGGGGPGSNSTGDHDCTSSQGSDCGDLETDAIFDTDQTLKGQDGCGVASSSDYSTGSASYSYFSK